MTRQIINVGVADKGNGDPIRVAFSKANDNFAELYNILSNNTGGSIITTDVIGSVFADDSTLLVDGINGRIPYSVLSGAPTIPTSFSSLVNGAQTVSLSSSPVSGTTFSSGLTIHRLSGSMANITSDINKVLQIATQTSNGRNEWSFGTNGSLTFPDATVQTTAYNPSNIRSEGNINIDINLADSTLRRWQFGEDGILTLPSVGKINNGAYDWTFGSTGITTFPGVIKAGNINNLVVNDLGGPTLTVGSQIQIGNSANAGAGVLIKNAVTNTLGGEFSSTLEAGSKIQMDNGNVSLSGYTYNTLGGESPSGLENRLVVEIDNSYLNNVVRIGTRTITTNGGDTITSFQGVTFSRYGELTFPDNTVQTTAWTGIANALCSEGNINIDINLTDSTLRRWQFGEDGKLTLPSVGKINNGAYDWTFGTDGKLTAPGNLQVDGGKIILNTGGNAYVESVDYGVNSANSAVNIFGGPYQKIKLRAGFGTQATWTFGTDGTLTFPDNTVQTTASKPFSFSVAADDSTQRAISNNESIKFTGAGGVTTSSDAEGNITITGSKVIGEWTVTTGTSTYSFTVPMDGTYVMWVKGNIPNGIITWNATLSISNTNVPAIGTQYAWNYTGGGSPILLTAIPNQIRGSAGTISTDATYAGTTSNIFDFGISNTSGANQTVYYGYTKIS